MSVRHALNHWPHDANMKMPTTRYLLTSTLLACSFLGSSLMPAQAQSNVNETVSQTLYASPGGSTTADGKSQANAVTFSRAISLIGTASTKIVLLNGDYRGSWRIGNYGNNTIILEAQNPRQAIFSGSTLVSSWNTEANGAFSIAWTNNWGLGGSAGFPINLDALSQRREMLFINGTRLQQRCNNDGSPVSTSALGDGQFTVDEAADKIFFKPPSGVGMTGARVEVATQTGKLLEIDDRDNVVIRGLVFRHSANYIRFNPALEIKYSNNVLVDNVQCVNNNSIGFELPVTDNVTVKNSDMSDNGSRGGGQGSCNNVLVQDSTFNRNNWRFGGHLIGHDSGGWKIFDGDGNTNINYKFLRCKFQDNNANGWWQDFGGDPPGDGPNTIIERCLIENNQGGLQQELTYGGLLVKDTVIRGNTKFNVLSLGSPRMTFQNCFIYGVKASYYESDPENCTNFLIAADTRTNPNNGSGVPQDSRYFTITDSTIIATEAETQIMKTGRGFNGYNTPTWGKDKFINTLTSDRNVWWRRDRTYFPAPYEFFGFRVFNDWRDDHADSTWQEWRSHRSGVLDPNSLYQDANLSNVPDPTTTLIDAGTTGNGTNPPPTPTPGANLVSNPSFDAETFNTQTPSGWSETGTVATSYTENLRARSGSRHLTHYNGSAYTEAVTSQTKTGLQNGSYTLRAWVQGGGGFTRAFMYAKSGTTTQQVNIPTASAWTQISISGFNVSNGSMEIGFLSQQTGGRWFSVDDVELTRNTSTTTPAPVGKTIGWKALNNNLFVSTNLNSSNYLQAGWSTAIGNWERFKVLDAGNGKVALLSLNNNLYVSCNTNNSGYLQAGWATSIGAWELFTWEDRGSGKFALKADNNGRYVSNNLNANKTLQALATSVGTWEEFQFQETP